MILSFFHWKFIIFWCFLFFFVIFCLYIRRGMEFWYPEKKGCPFLCSPILPKRTILRLSIEEKRSFSGIPFSFFVQLRQIFMRTWSSYSFCQLIFWCSLFFFVSVGKLVSHLMFDYSSISCGVSEISVNSKGYKQHFSALGQYGRA